MIRRATHLTVQVQGREAARAGRSRALPAACMVAGLLAAVLVSLATQGSTTAASASGAFDEGDAHVRAAMDAWGVPGAAYAVVEGGEVTHLASFGSAGSDGRAMTPDTPVVIGSVGKSITALAISQLVAAGRVDLGAPVTRYLPFFALAGPEGAGSRMTVRALLAHTSGLSTADGQDSRWYAPGLAPVDVVRGLASVRADAAGRYAYSNLNYVILGVIVEAVSGSSYGDYIREHIFGPLGMTRSFTSLEAAAASMPAQGHRYLFGIPVPFDEPYPTGMVAAGYQVSTARDMARFVAALSNGGVLDGVDVVAPGSAPAAGQAFGTDWQRSSALGPGAVISQSGSTLSSNADILVQPDRRLGVAVLFNANPTQLLGVPGGAADVALDVLRLWTGGRPGSGSPSVRTAYLVVDGVLITLALLFAVHIARARTWRRRYATAGRRSPLVVRTIAADLLLPAAVLIGVPLWIGFTGSSAPGDVRAGWSFALWTLPDISVTVLALALGGVAVGTGKLLAARSLRRADPSDDPRVSSG